METNTMGTLTDLKPTKVKQPPLVKPPGGGLVEKALVVGGGVSVIVVFGATMPLATGAAIVAMGVYFWDEVKTFRTKDTSEELEAILNASTPRHPSINDLRSQLKTMYPTAAINHGIESMLGNTGWVQFGAKDKHHLAPFGSVYCWINPEDSRDVKLPLERLEQLLEAWGLVPTVETTATPHQGEELASPSPAPTMATTTTASYPGREELIARLKAEAPELLRLVKAPPIRLVGLQRTGKSTFAQRLTLLRMVLLPGHSAAWATPHKEADNPVPSILAPVGYTATGAKDYPSIEALWVNTQARIDQGEQVNQTVVWDEFGGYDSFQDVELLKGSLRSLLREATKHQYYPILIAHGDQASFYPGVANILSTIKLSTVKVETHGQPADDFGTMAPTGRAMITWLDGSTSEVTWPTWLTADYLLAILQAPPAPPAMAPVVAPVADNSAVDTDAYGAAEGPAGEPTTEDDNARRVAAKLAAKLEDAKGEWVTIRDLTINLFRQPQDRELATQMIRDLINEYRLESIDKMNPNKTVSVFVRLKPADPPANNSLN
jgi:hypothetical protein